MFYDYSSGGRFVQVNEIVIIAIVVTDIVGKIYLRN